MLSSVYNIYYQNVRIIESVFQGFFKWDDNFEKRGLPREIVNTMEEDGSHVSNG